MNTQTPFYIISAERVGLHPVENAARSEGLQHQLTRLGAPLIEVRGRYEGSNERAFLVLDESGHKHFDTLIRLARAYQQHSLLYVDGNRFATLHSPRDGTCMEILGVWHEVEPAIAERLEAVTVTPDGRLWSASGGSLDDVAVTA